MGLWIGVAFAVGGSCSAGWARWNPLLFYWELNQLSYSPWALFSSEIGGALRDAQREVFGLVSVAALTGGAYFYGGEPAAAKAFIRSGARLRASRGRGRLCRDPGGLDPSWEEPEWVESARGRAVETPRARGCVVELDGQRRGAVSTPRAQPRRLFLLDDDSETPRVATRELALR